MLNNNIKKAGVVLNLLLNELTERTIAGTTGIRLNDFAEYALKWYCPEVRLACKGYKGFPSSLCISINDGIIHGTPSDRIFINGDIVKIDVVLEYNGWFADSARTIIVGESTEQNKKLVRVTKECLYKGIAVAKHRWATGDIGYIIQQHAEKNGFSVMKDFSGHGIGTKIHQEPNIPCYGKQRKGTKLIQGMYICIEPMLFMGKPDIERGKDGWNVKSKDGLNTAHFEHTILITRNSPVILT